MRIVIATSREMGWTGHQEMWEYSQRAGQFQTMWAKTFFD